MLRVRFTTQAETDIINGYLYGLERFGREQAEKYEKDLRDIIDVIAANPRIAAERPEFRPPVRIHHHAKHYIVYLVRDPDIVIVRILREEADLARHLGPEA